jgi:hypothetical protein
MVEKMLPEREHYFLHSLIPAVYSRHRRSEHHVEMSCLTKLEGATFRNGLGKHKLQLGKPYTKGKAVLLNKIPHSTASLHSLSEGL